MVFPRVMRRSQSKRAYRRKPGAVMHFFFFTFFFPFSLRRDLFASYSSRCYSLGASGSSLWTNCLFLDRLFFFLEQNKVGTADGRVIIEVATSIGFYLFSVSHSHSQSSIRFLFLCLLPIEKFYFRCTSYNVIAYLPFLCGALTTVPTFNFARRAVIVSDRERKRCSIWHY